MGESTNGQICYGVVFDEDYEFPWDDEKYEGGIEAWWRDVNNFVNPAFNPFTEEGDYKPGVANDDPRISKYFKQDHEWDKAHPLPVELVNYCSGDCPMFILAVKESCISNNRGFPVQFDPSSLTVSDEARRALLKFCVDYGLEISTEEVTEVREPEWLLSSYWG